MTDKQTLFISEYLKDFNGSRAARDAGYSEDTAGPQACRLLKNVNVRQEIQEYIDSALSDDHMSLKKRIIDGLQVIAFGSSDETSHGSQLKALELLGKYLALFTDKLQIGKISETDRVFDWADEPDTSET